MSEIHTYLLCKIIIIVSVCIGFLFPAALGGTIFIYLVSYAIKKFQSSHQKKSVYPPGCIAARLLPTKAKDACSVAVGWTTDDFVRST